LAAEYFGVHARVEMVESREAEIPLLESEYFRQTRQFIQFHAPAAALPKPHGFGCDVQSLGDMRLVEAEFLAAAPQDLMKRHGAIEGLCHRLWH
jgi:hypothetical protein